MMSSAKRTEGVRTIASGVHMAPMTTLVALRGQRLGVPWKSLANCAVYNNRLVQDKLEVSAILSIDKI